MDDPYFMDPMLDRDLYYLDSFDRSNGILIHLNQDPIKHKGSNIKFKGP